MFLISLVLFGKRFSSLSNRGLARNTAELKTRVSSHGNSIHASGTKLKPG
jgi:hypothetical protein